MNSSKKESYNLVFDDLISNYGGLLRGTYDAKNGNEAFMYGILTVLEIIAYNAGGEEKVEVLDILFTMNMEESERKVNGDK
jgi:hypothetical protein